MKKVKYPTLGTANPAAEVAIYAGAITTLVQAALIQLTSYDPTPTVASAFTVIVTGIFLFFGKKDSNDPPVGG